MLAPHASAQSQDDTALPAAQAGTPDDIVVTGSRIARPDLTGSVPVAVVGAADIQADAALNIQDTLNQLPQFGVGTSRTNSNFNTSGNGTATLNLRSLGNNRTLTLVNGRRYVAGFAGQSTVDVNNIPTDFIQRIDVVTGGASSVYGSDAIAGVVNFIMRDSFDGVQLRAQSGVTEQGDNGRYLVTLTGGSTLADGRWKMIGNLTYDRDQGLRSNARARSAEDCGTPLGNAAGIICGPASYSVFGPQGQFYYDVRGTGATPTTNINTSSFSFDGTNNLIFGTGPGFNRNAERFISVPVERYMAAFNTTFEISPAATLFLETNYNKVKSRSSLEPSAISIGSALPSTDVTSSIAITNPFIPAPVQAIIAARNSDADPTNDIVGITARRRFNEVFDRSNVNDRDTLRFAGGIRGDVGGGWRYDASYVFGRFQDYTASETAIKSRIAEALDVVSVNGQFVCRSEAARAAGCRPLNIFGANSASPEASAYVVSPIPRSLRVVNQQHVATVNLSGSPFSLWAGDVGIAVGAEYRKEKASSDNDALTNAGLNIGNLTQDLAGEFDVWEAYGEVNLPLIRDSFVKYLGLIGAVRYSDYSTVGSVVSWNAGAEFEPVDGLKFRGVYARANRAPNVSELFQAANETFATITDPCNGVTATNNPGVSATFPGGFGDACRRLPAVQAAVANGGTFNYSLAQQQAINGFVGGNPGLAEETANTLTLGGVLTPRFLPGFSLTVDYYNIKLDGAIATLGRQFTVQQCLQSNDPVFCSQVIRGADGRIATVNGTLINVAQTKTDGIDFQARYGAGVFNGDRIDLSVYYTMLLRYKTQANPAAAVVENRGTAGSGLHKHRVFGRLTYTVDGGFSATWQANYLSPAVSSVTFTNSNAAIEALNRIPAYSYHDLQLRWDGGTDKKFGFYVGVDNIFDKQPPYLPNPPFSNSITGTETQADVYDVFGRRFYAGIRAKF
ncbi:TonB-dependent receptor domain-containing protein [Sphingomonas adhaesiva]|uniref:TonB-dependent receptor domain-containing protein n=1 Tax=Sphingomonas adhaesiva TaxID=28212 RepID=UPI002FF880FC